MRTIKLTKDEEDFLVIELNCQLRSCDPRGYPNNNSGVLTLAHATTLNGLFKKLTGENHESFTKWKAQLK